LLLLVGLSGATVSAQQNLVYFPQTGHFLGGAFRTYFDNNGSVGIFGYPVTEEYVRSSDGVIVQYFERARFELRGTEFDTVVVRQGDIGSEAAAQLGYNFAPVAPFPDTATRRYFPETGHSLRGGFKAFWDANNGAKVFGAPISEEFTEFLVNGQRHTVQYFERARFELHGDQILLGRLGIGLAPCQQLPPRPQSLPPSGPLPEGDGRNCEDPTPTQIIGRVYPEAALPGTLMGFEARGYEPGELVSLWLNLPDQNVRELAYRAVADADGAVLIGFRTRDSDPSGTWSLVGEGVESKRVVVAPFRVTR
jgi:hypothetical protein